MGSCQSPLENGRNSCPPQINRYLRKKYNNNNFRQTWRIHNYSDRPNYNQKIIQKINNQYISPTFNQKIVQQRNNKYISSNNNQQIVQQRNNQYRSSNNNQQIVQQRNNQYISSLRRRDQRVAGVLCTVQTRTYVFFESQ